MPETLAQLVRAKFPGAYDDMDDAALESAVTAKFPGAYDDVPRTTAAPAAVARPRSWSERAGLNTPLGNTKMAGPVSPRQLVDFVEGAASGLASTVFHGGDLIRRGLGMERVIDSPEAQQAMRAPETTAGTVGRVVEQGAEFALPLSKVSRATSALSVIPRVAADAAASAGIAGIQSGGDTTQMAIAAALPAGLAGARGARQVVGRAAAGAKEGGVGGALASVARKAAPMDAHRSIVQAIKPRNSLVNFDASVQKALPELKAVEQEIGKPIESLDDLLSATKQAKQRVRAIYDQIAGPQRAMGSTVDLTPVATAMESSIPSKVRLQSPETAESIRKMADPYRTRFSLEDAETLLRETNAELSAYYSKFPAARRSAEAANPEVAHLVAQAKALRTAIYNTLDAPGQGAAAREAQRRYGALMELEDAALRRSNVAKRQQPESLSEQIGKVRAAADMARGVWRMAHGDLTGMADVAASRAGAATATFLKEQQTTDALIRRAFQSFKTLPTPIPMPVQRPVAGYLPRGPIVTPPPADPSFVRGVSATPAAVERRALPPGPIMAGPAPDPSFVRAVPATPATVERLALPPKSSGPEIPSSGRVIAPAGKVIDASSVRVVPAVPAEIDYVPAKAGSRKTWRQETTQYSSDPNAAPVSGATLMARATPETKQALRWIAQDMDAMDFTPRTFNRAARGRGGDLEVVAGAGGAPIYQEIVGSGISATRAAVKQAIRELAEGTGKPTRLKQAIVEVAESLGRGDRRLRRMMVLPPSSAETAAATADDGFSAFADDIDAIASEPGAREPGEEGIGTIGALLGMGAGSTAATAAALAARRRRQGSQGASRR